MNYLPLTLDDISLRLSGHACLTSINLSIKQPGVYAIIGPNGSGKSMLLNIIAGLTQASGGNISWGQQPKPPAITWLPTQAILLKRSVLDNLLAVLSKNQQATAQAALSWAGIEPWAERIATELSTGEQQRVALARAYAVGARILLIDEPYANLDPQAQTTVEGLLFKLKEAGCTVIITGHKPLMYRALADYVFTLENGKLLKNREV